jgi:hypothetical protein
MSLRDYFRASRRARSLAICCSRFLESASSALTSSSRRTIRSLVAGRAVRLAAWLARLVCRDDVVRRELQVEAGVGVEALA